MIQPVSLRRQHDDIPAPAEARAAARREIPRQSFRGWPVADLGYNVEVAAQCSAYDVRTARLWGPPGGAR